MAVGEVEKRATKWTVKSPAGVVTGRVKWGKVLMCDSDFFLELV